MCFCAKLAGSRTKITRSSFVTRFQFLNPSTRSDAMKRIFPPLVILILTAILVSTPSAVAVVAEHGPSASGSGLFRFRNPLAQTELWSFSFEARANKNGQARGRAQFENLTAQTQVVVRINCLSVDSPFAIMSGRILHSDDPNLPKLTNVIFAASDGQLLPNPGVDTITPPFPLPGNNCQDTQPLTILPVEDGNIEIQP